MNVPLAHENLAPGASEAELRELEEGVGFALPEEVRAVLSVHNGQRVTMTASRTEPAVPCVPTLSFLSTALIRECWEDGAELRRDPDLAGLQQVGDVFPGARGKVKPLYTSAGWIPLWSDPVRSDYTGLDLDPDTGGTHGQIINFGRDEEKHFVCATDFTDLLTMLLEEVRTGAWRASQIPHGAQQVPWFGDPEEHFFNALYDRFERRTVQ
ncbi:SMI1/KNR4 family protein [Nocardia puris]|uniref:Cell wall assembly regulator SMI1 n=1 Tax=Nocardia puris TaxID=208602 RepID=A0A366DNV5_9NOCA|nr:SMI1/KNR4 family protein [Nocardia puris]MBF6369596.1 SMI1/KNR4 family protein [Nocardia puris]MBF6459037.1 SMI1/KNR4 family protein [Nocardia puris]RBO90898.1 cell wall assembly regulator SMI1 [Nocardia puris]